jgi:hypothetical protein
MSPSHPADEILLGFAHALRAAGLHLSTDRAQTFLRAVGAVGLPGARGVYWAGWSTLCSSPDDVSTYDAVFDRWFGHQGSPGEAVREADPDIPQAHPGEQAETAGEDTDDAVSAVASSLESLRRKDIAELSTADRARLAALYGTLRPRPPRRPAPRRSRSHRGEVDVRRTLRAMMDRFGEPAPIAWHRKRVRPRRVVLLVDVSGSMNLYTESLLRLAHRFVQAFAQLGADVDVFTVGTRLTHVTRAMRHRDPGRALLAAAGTVPDWSGGTRLGECLRVFLDHWGQRGTARGAVTVIFSDGWERGSADLLAQQVERLGRLSHQVVWVSPHRGKPGYLPLQQGIAAVLPHLDHFLAGHSLQSFEELVDTVAGA